MKIKNALSYQERFKALKKEIIKNTPESELKYVFKIGAGYDFNAYCFIKKT